MQVDTALVDNCLYVRLAVFLWGFMNPIQCIPACSALKEPTRVHLIIKVQQSDSEDEKNEIWGILDLPTRK